MSKICCTCEMLFMHSLLLNLRALRQLLPPLYASKLGDKACRHCDHNLQLKLQIYMNN